MKLSEILFWFGMILLIVACCSFAIIQIKYMVKHGITRFAVTELDKRDKSISVAAIFIFIAGLSLIVFGGIIRKTKLGY
jgi:hypothetical protein